VSTVLGRTMPDACRRKAAGRSGFSLAVGTCRPTASEHRPLMLSGFGRGNHDQGVREAASAGGRCWLPFQRVLRAQPQVISDLSSLPPEIQFA
jgi:hypothetical protein